MGNMEHIIEQVAQTIRRTREFQAGAAFGVPEDAHEDYALGVARALAEAGYLTAAVSRAEQLEREIKQLHKVIDEKVREANESADYQEQIDAELRSAGVRVELTDPPTVSVLAAIPPVSRDDIDRALINVTSNAMNYPTPSQMLGKDSGPLRKKCVDAVCELFGIED